MEGFFFIFGHCKCMSFDRLTACLTRIDAEYKAPELAQTSKKHSFSESAERVLFVYLALAMLDCCIPVTPRLFPRQKQSEVHTMHDRKSLYSRNKRNSRAILCPDAFEQDHPLTPEQFSYEEEFRFWKMWSDENYHGWELADHMLLTRPLYRKLLFPILRRRRSHSPN